MIDSNVSVIDEARAQPMEGGLQRPMVTEPITRISFEPTAPQASPDLNQGHLILQEVAATTAVRLEKGGFLSQEESEDFWKAYCAFCRSSCDSQDYSRDFLIFAAHRYAEIHSIAPDDSIHRMQKMLWEQLQEALHYWSLGSLPGGSRDLFEKYPSIESASMLLLCPVFAAGEDSIIHVAALNPIAGLVTAEWVRHELRSGPSSEESFLFTFAVGFPAWINLQQMLFQHEL